MLGKSQQRMLTRRALPSDVSLLDRHHGQDHAPISVRVVWRCTGMLMQNLGTGRGSHPWHGPHLLHLSNALSQAILLFGRRRLDTRERGARDRDLASSKVGSSKVGKRQLQSPRSRSDYELRAAKYED
jgi:hypothetical protein